MTMAFSNQCCLSQSLGRVMSTMVVRISPIKEMVRMAGALFMITSSFMVAIAVTIRYSSAREPTWARDSLSIKSYRGVFLRIIPVTRDTIMAGT